MRNESDQETLYTCISFQKEDIENEPVKKRFRSCAGSSSKDSLKEMLSRRECVRYADIRQL